MSATRVLVRCNTLGDVQGLVLRVSVDLVVAQTLLRSLPHLGGIFGGKIPSLAENIAYRREELGHWIDLVFVLAIDFPSQLFVSVSEEVRGQCSHFYFSMSRY